MTDDAERQRASLSPVTRLRDRALGLLEELVAFPTVTGEPNLALIDRCRVLLEEVGATTTTTTDPTGTRANLFATIGPAADGGVVLSGHTDVVPPGVDGWDSPAFSTDVRGGRVHGRGTVDMKGFIACVLAVAPAAAAAGLRRPLHVALTYDEEVGCRGAPSLLAELARTGPRPAAAIVGEPTMLGVISAHKGCFEYTTLITGREGHGSLPAEGVNAAEFGARYVARLLELRDELAVRAPADSVFTPPETTLNVGRIDAGTARNVVAGRCVIEWEFRPVQPGDATFVEGAVDALESRLVAEMQQIDPTAGITTVVEGAVDGLEDDGESAALALCRRLLGAPAVDVVPFSTEAGLYQRAGIPAVVCGPGSIEVAHRPNEYVEVEQLDRCLEMLGRLVTELAAPDATG